MLLSFFLSEKNGILYSSERKVPSNLKKGLQFMENDYIIEMLGITKEFPGIKANDNINLQVKRGEIHALLGENGAGKSTLMSILFGLYQPTSGIIKKNGREVQINSPNDANELNIGMVHQLYRDNEVLIFDEPTAVLTPQEISELMKIMKNLAKEGKSILFITHKLNEIMEVADRCTILRRGKYIGTVNIADTSKEELSKMMVGRNVSFTVDKKEKQIGDTVLKVEHLTVPSKAHSNNAVKDVSFNVRKGEIVCIAGIDGNGQSELVQGLTGLEKISGGTISFNGQDITKASIRDKSKLGMSHIPEDRHKHGLVLDYTLEQNMVLQRYWQPDFQAGGFIKAKAVRDYAEKLIEQYDVRSGQGPVTVARSMSGGNQQKAIIAREIDKDPDLLVAVQPTRGLDVGAIEFIHKQLVAQRDKGKAVLLISFELDEVMDVSDRILVMYEGELVGQFDPKQITVEELGLYMAGAKRSEVPAEV